MENFNYEKFCEVYYSQIEPELLPLEQERKKVIGWIPEWLPGVEAITFLLIFLNIIIMRLILNVEVLEKIVPPMLITAISLFAHAFFCFFKIDSFQKKIKRQIYEKLFKAVNFKYKNISNDKTLNNKINCVSKKLIYFKSIQTDDYISGVYNGLKFDIMDLILSSKTENGSSIDFCGVLISTKINKKFTSETIIKKDYKILNSEKRENKTVVKVEDVQFEKEFEVYSTEQVEARYILTTSFMERLLKYKKKNNCPVEMVISNNLVPDQNVFFYIYKNGDSFEVPVFSTLLDKDKYYNVLKEVFDALDVISELKLEQNIGL